MFPRMRTKVKNFFTGFILCICGAVAAAGLTDLSNGVKGVLPVINGGTGSASGVIASTSISASSVAATNITATSAVIGTISASSVTAVSSVAQSVTASAVTANTSFNFAKLSSSATNPFISSGFGYVASAVLSNANGTAAFEIPVSGVTSQSGVVGLPTATTGWACHTFNEVHSASSVAVIQIASTASSVTLNNYNASQVSDNFPTSSVIHGSCFAY